jgi:glycosyltransferase involved in cell wall biosynthesis
MTSPSAEPLVSITMPVFNGARFLAKTVASILAQTHRNLELIAVDDGSTDDSVDILRGFEDPRIRIILPGKHVGAVCALNIATEEARAEFIARNDQDDISHPTRIERQLRHFTAYPELTLVSCWMRCIGDDDSVLPVAYRAATDHEKALERMLLRGCPFGHSGVMYRKAAVMAIGGYCDHPSVRECPDYDLWLRLAHAGARFGGIPEFLADYRIHEAQMSRLRLAAANQVNRVRVRALNDWGRRLLTERGISAPSGLLHSLTGGPGSLADDHSRRSDWHRVLGKRCAAHKHAYAALMYGPMSGRAWRQAYKATIEKGLGAEQQRVLKWYLTRLATFWPGSKRRP